MDQGLGMAVLYQRARAMATISGDGPLSLREQCVEALIFQQLAGTGCKTAFWLPQTAAKSPNPQSSHPVPHTIEQHVITHVQDTGRGPTSLTKSDDCTELYSDGTDTFYILTYAYDKRSAARLLPSFPSGVKLDSHKGGLTILEMNRRLA